MFKPHLAVGAVAAATSPPPLQLEPIAPAPVLQFANTVDTAARQSWHGFGWGLGVPTSDARTVINNNILQLFGQLGTTVMRFNSPHDAAQATIGKGTVDIGVANGVDTVIATGYLWRVQRDGETSYSATIMANEIHALMNAGMLITHATLQNEPDGHVRNSPEAVPPPVPPAANPAGVVAQVVARYNELYDQLVVLGRATSVKLYGIEWAHHSGFGQYSEQEYDALNAAGMIPGRVAFAGGHSYHDCPTNTQYDSRWMTKTSGGVPISGIISSEIGFTDAPHWGARCIAGLNHGTVMEVCHIGASTSADNTQSFVNNAGALSTAHAQARVIYGRQPSGDITIPRGSVFRLVTCDDRPSGLNTTFADRMIRGNGNFYPRINSACCKRTDGRWSFVCCNTTHGATDESAGSPAQGGVGLSGHYAQQTIQITATIPELSSTTATWSAHKCTMTGVLSTQTVNMVNGVIRFTLGPGETIGMISSGVATQTWSDGSTWSDFTGWMD